MARTLLPVRAFVACSVGSTLRESVGRSLRVLAGEGRLFVGTLMLDDVHRR